MNIELGKGGSMPSNRWVHRIRKGDILRFPGDILRVVRDVSHYRKSNRKPHTNVTLAIRRCSRTGRPYTVYTHRDLLNMGVRPTRARVALRGKLDKAIEHNFSGRDGLPVLPDFTIPGEFECKCCDVIGVVN
jgi:hypothetical protein